MSMDTCVNFQVKAMGFPTGKIYKMHTWIKGHVEDSGKYIDKNVDRIKEELEEMDICIVHSIEHSYTTFTNTSHEGEEYGDIILDKEITVSTSNKNKDKKKENTQKLVTDIYKIDLPNIDSDDLTRLRGKIGVELFKRTHKLSDAVYEFYMMNNDKIDVEEAKKICEEHDGSVDLFLLKKKEIRKKIEEKIQTT